MPSLPLGNEQSIPGNKINTEDKWETPKWTLDTII